MTVMEPSFVESAPQPCQALRRTMQCTLVPPIAFESSRLEVYGSAIPRNAVGGDLADLVTSKRGVVAYVADVSGHDVFAGMLMGMVKTAARYGLMLWQPLPELLDGINHVLPSVKEPNMYATFAGLRLDRSGEMDYIIAGNMPLLQYRKSRKSVVRLAMEQFPLGLFHDARYSSSRVDYGPGDLFAIFTDGLVETTDVMGQEFGLDRMEDVLLEFAAWPLRDTYDAVLDAVGRHGRQADDRTLMLVRVLAPPGDRHAD